MEFGQIETLVSTGGIDVTAILNPFKLDRITKTVSQGMTVREILDCVGADPLLAKHAHVFIGSYFIAKENWHLVRPRAGAKLSIRAFIPPAGGDSGGGKDVLRTVMIIAIAAAALAFGPALGGALGLTGALAASVGQAVIGIGGMLLVNALVPPRTTTATVKGNTANADESPTKFIEGASNRLAPFEPVDTPFGRIRIFPKLAAQPYTELVGDDQYLRLLFNWGIGPLSLSGFKIGETDLSAFDGVDVEHFEGYVTDTSPTLFPNTVNQDAFQITLLQVDGYTTRTSGVDADELSVEVVFPEGLITIAEDGTRSNGAVTVQVQYSVHGAGVWNSIPVTGGKQTFDLSWTNGSGGPYSQITFTQKKTAAIRHGFTWKTPARGQYDIRIKRVTADSALETVRDTVVFTTLRTFTNSSPINSPVPVALTALRIKASNQLSGVIDNFSGIVQRVAQHWNGSAWALAATQNPGALFRYALQSNALQAPKTDAELDLPSIQHFADHCITHGFAFNQNRDFVSTLWDLLQDIAASGRGSPTLIDGKYGVIIDEPKEPVTLVTPRNSWGFQASKAFLTTPHAFRIPFQNEEKDWRTDELRIYLPGYNAANATIFESMEHVGVTKPSLIASQTLFNIACAVQRPESWTWQQDMERLAYRRGDVVFIQTDVLLVGLASGRITALTYNGGGDVTGMSSDETLVISAGGNYGVSIRNVNNVAITGQVVTNAGSQTSIVFTNAIPAASAPAVGDLFSFGVLGSETDKALILGYDPSDSANMGATMVAVPYRAAVYTADSVIPPFSSQLTSIDPVPSVEFEYIRSDETVLSVGAGNSLEVRIAVKIKALTSIDGVLQTQIRPSANNEPFANAQVTPVSSNEVLISDIRTGEYVDLRFRWIVAGRTPGAWSYSNNYRVIGKSSAPQPLQNMTLSAFGGQAFIRWDQPTDLDVRFGGSVYFRHSEDLTPSWANSVSIGNAAQANTLLATLPLKSGTYLARVFDSSGNQSTVELINTKQASVLTYGTVNEFYESPTFTGTKSGVIADSISGQNMLFIDASGDWDSIPDVDLFLEFLDAYGGVKTTDGVYTFALGMDFTTVKRIRLTTVLKTFNVSVFDYVDSWTDPIDDRTDFDGTDSAVCDCIIYVSLTDDDPNGVSPTWTDYERLDSAEIQARGCRFKAVLSSTNPAYNIYVVTMGIKAEEVV